MKLKFLLLLLYLTSMNTHAQEHTYSPNVSWFTIHSPQLKTDRKIWVYLPEDYKDTNHKYPVMYMHDGQNLFDKATSFSGEWRIDEQLDSLHAKTIIIGIEHGGDKRIEELTPHPNEKYGGGNADAYLDFLVNTLKPYVDTHYRTKQDKEHTAIFGSSLGGLVSFYAVLKYPKVFGKAGVFSPSFWFNDDIFDLAIKTEHINARLYFMAGDHESENMQNDLERMLDIVLTKTKKKNIHKKIVHNGRHNETLWGKEFAEAYTWLTD
ncbi:MAG: alpha-mannosidase [Flavobacterium psychrophilum]|nr:MAG: alpha-mannosidase [Flavobacterium psychrophilum]